MVPRHQDGHTAPTLLAAVGCELQRFGANPTQCPVALHGSPGFVPSLFVPTHCAFPFFPPFSLSPLHPLLIAASNSHTHSSLLTRPFGISTWHLQSSSFWKRGEKKKEKKKERKRKTTLLKKIYMYNSNNFSNKANPALAWGSSSPWHHALLQGDADGNARRS